MFANGSGVNTALADPVLTRIGLSIVCERSMAADSCYACDYSATSREHVPPLCIFPEDKDLPGGMSMRRGSLIRVPSCAAHNTEKSDDDEYFRFVLASNVMANHAGHGQTLTKVLRSFLRRPTVKERFLQGAKPVRIQESHGTNVHEAVEVPLEFERFKWIPSPCCPRRLPISLWQSVQR